MSRSWWMTQSRQHYRRGCNNIPSFLQQTTPIVHSLCEGWTRHDLHILVTAPFYCDRKFRTTCAQSFAPWQQATIEIMLAISLTIACSHYIYNGVIFHAHPLRGESHNQRNTTGEVATHKLPRKKDSSVYVKVFCSLVTPLQDDSSNALFHFYWKGIVFLKSTF